MMHLVNGMLLAAGRGERMEPLSSVIPKPALEVLGRPLLASALAQLRGAGCERVVVNLHRHPEMVVAAARDAGGELTASWEPELLGGAGGLCAARPLLATGAVLVGNADVWSDLDLAPLLGAGDDGTAVLALLPHPDPARWSSVVLDDGHLVQAFLPPGATHAGERYVFTGFQLIGAAVVATLPAPPAEMPMVWQALLRRGALRGVTVRGGWHEVGTPGAYRELVTWLLGQDSWADPQARVSEGARVQRSAIGAGCRVGADAGVCESVLTAGAAVEGGCELQRCVLAGPVTVSGASTFADTLILPQGRFPLR
jgi:NDP-sugar pyrophosphorylase family protein